MIVVRERFVGRVVTIGNDCKPEELLEAARDIAKFDREFAVLLLAVSVVTPHFCGQACLDFFNACQSTKFADTKIDEQLWARVLGEVKAIERDAEVPQRFGNPEPANTPPATGTTPATTNLTATTTVSTTQTVPATTTLTSSTVTATTPTTNSTTTNTTTTNSTTTSVTATTTRTTPQASPIQSVPRTLRDCLEAAGIDPDWKPAVASNRGWKEIFIRFFGGTRPLVARTGDGKATDMFTVSKSCTFDQLRSLAWYMDKCDHYSGAAQLLVSAALSSTLPAAERLACLASAVTWGDHKLNERNVIELAAEWRLLTARGIRLGDKGEQEHADDAVDRLVRSCKAEGEVAKTVKARAQKVHQQLELPDDERRASAVKRARDDKPLSARRSMHFGLSGSSPQTAIEKAFASEDWKSVRQLMREFDASPNRSVGESGTTVLGLACRHGALDIAREWVQSHIASVGTALFDPWSQLGESPLWLACRFGHDAIVKFLLQEGAMTMGSTGAPLAIRAAVEFGHLEVTKLLVDKNSSLLGDVLHAAVDMGRLPILKWHWRNAKPTTRETLRPSVVNRAAKCRSLKPMRSLIKQGVPLEETYGENTPMRTACAAGRLGTVKLLHANKARLTGADLLAACERRRVKVVEWLLRHMADSDLPKFSDEQLLAWQAGTAAQAQIASLILKFTHRKLTYQDLETSTEDSGSSRSSRSAE